MRACHVLPIAAVLLAGALSTAPAAAQGRSQATSFSGTLEPCPGGHRVRLEAGRRYALSASSDDFDTVLSVYRAGSGEVLAQDDDGGDNTNSRISFSPAQTGDYLLCVASFGSGGTGRYTVEAAPMGALRPPVTAPTGTETVTRRVYDGRLADGDDEENGSWFDDYQIRLEPGQRVAIGLDSEDFDPLLHVYAADRRGIEPVASDDDGGGGLNAFLTLASEEGGDYIVRVTSFSGGSGGAYRLSVSD